MTTRKEEDDDNDHDEDEDEDGEKVEEAAKKQGQTENKSREQIKT